MKGQKNIPTIIGALVGGAGAIILALDHSVKANDALHPARLPWSHRGHFNSLDHARLVLSVDYSSDILIRLLAERIRLLEWQNETNVLYISA